MSAERNLSLSAPYELSPWDEFVSQVSLALGGVSKERLSIPQRSASGGADLSSSIAFEIAKKDKVPPFKAAEGLSASIDLSSFPLIEKVENKGGYLNFFAKKGEIFSKTVSQAVSLGPEYGRSSKFSGKSALVEFPSVNPNKPWHIGHARNACLGDTLSRVLSKAGYLVRRLDYIDDLGLQVAKVYWGTKNLPAESRHQKFDQHLGLLYVDVEKESVRPEVETQVREIMKAMEEKKPPIGPAARALAEDCVRAQYLTAYRFGVFHDLLIFESEIVSSGLFSLALGKMLKTKVIYKATEGEKAGCIVCNVSGFSGFEGIEDTEVVLVRSDGTATYTAKDVAFQMWKFGLFENPFQFSDFTAQPNGVVAKKSSNSDGEKIGLGHNELVINVIGAEQAHPQRVVYSILGGMGFSAEESRSFHLSYEHVWLPEGKFSGRKGTWVGFSADDVLEEAVTRAREEVEKRSPELSSEEKAKISEAVGVGAVRYTLLKYAPEKKITFRWDEALSFEGDSAPYLQYALARCRRILEKAGRVPEKREISLPKIENLEEDEYLLAKQVSLLPSEVERISSSLKKEVWGTRTEISRIAEYSFQLATMLSKFYTTCRVLGSEHEERRLALVEAAYWSLYSGLTLLGIPVIERM